MKILGVEISEVDREPALAIAKDFFNTEKLSLIFTPNPEIVMLAQENDELKIALDGADLCLPDGIGVVIASRILKNPIQERIAGYDFLLELLKLRKKVFLLGSKDGIAEKCAEKLQNVVGYHHGYFDESETDSIITKINSSRAELLVVALGAPKQELWLWSNRDRLNCKVAIGVGGALDVISGNVKRAPIIWQKLCLEWLYRAICEPKRFKRLAILPKFAIDVIRSRVKHGIKEEGNL